MIKLIAITIAIASLAACSSMNKPMAGNPAETKNSTDANKSSNPAAVSPGGATGASGAGAAGTGATK
jgi:hypothetical protein